jgi:biotin synthase-like enzyme
MFVDFHSYDFPPFRPPNEANSALIRITRGCPWNRCEFCAMYKHLKFESKPLPEVKEDVHRARQIYGAADTIFLGDSDNLVHKDLPEIVTFIRKLFPETQRITTYARAKTILHRKMAYLKSVRKAGLDRLHLGLESGDEIVLERLCKGAKPEEMIRAGQKAKAAGFEVSFYVLSGAGGKDRWREHAKNSAMVLNAARPDFIRLRTLTIQYRTPLDEKFRKGEFALTPPLERLEEVKLFLETLDVKNCFLASDHLTNYLWAGNTIIYRGVAGTLPDDTERMIAHVKAAIDYIRTTDKEIKDSNLLYREGLISSL